ncbi:hypothetical protein Pst134EA_017146 [Puccinia striiformis f. sp. tritici]|uniref:hypothetical protein n=1 Tax=Puccinia striiformis f. sp. tritici TaxID=168172 RepID=UPI002007E235|nr:hypothetical protein Pst134EA_017146 [Puccinia striiformis f. sp. tritici]KAH9460831.1 hypothetical protein Pst134EA_017146 [Puccinia striiformis f. sp. tritici]
MHFHDIVAKASTKRNLFTINFPEFSKLKILDLVDKDTAEVLMDRWLVIRMMHSWLVQISYRLLFFGDLTSMAGTAHSYTSILSRAEFYNLANVTLVSGALRV